jgi:hypothetical protein
MRLSGLLLLIGWMSLVTLMTGCSRGISLHARKEAIQAELQKLMPLGTSYETAASELSRRFGRVQRNENTGFLLQEGPRTEVVGVRSLEVRLGEYRHLPLGSTVVQAFFGFDKDGKLIQIWVWKTTDAL